MQSSVTLHMNASPEQIWPLVSDVVTNARCFAAETFDAEWLDGAAAPSVGRRFRGRVNRNGWGVKYWSVCRVDSCSPGEEFAFTAMIGRWPVNRWRYVLVPSGAGTDVTESFELRQSAPLRLYWALFGRRRGKTNAANMRTTLERIKAAVEGQDR
jgi:hypothetical protein